MAEALGVVSSVIAVVYLTAKVLSLCLQYSREVKNARDDIERLRKEVAACQVTVKELKALIEGPRGGELNASQQLISAMQDVHSTLGELEQQLRPSTHRKAMGRFGMRAFKWPFESKDIEGSIRNLLRCRENVSLALDIDQTIILQNVDDRTALIHLPTVHGAAFDSKSEEHNPKCLPNTRQELLGDIDRWIDDPTSKIVYWLMGMAGTGKLTVARTVARSRSKRGDLGASFFFKRGEMDRGNLDKFVPTLAHQLALSIPGVGFFVKKALNANPSIVGKSVKEQFAKLIQEPLSEAASIVQNPSSVVMVIDALDECNEEADVRSLIKIFSQTNTVRPRLRMFLTSRPELPVRLGFSEVQGSYQDLALHNIPAPIVEHDIFIFLSDEFSKIRHDFNITVGDERKLSPSWPGRSIVQRLSQMAVPLFIFAATICRFIGDRRRRKPRTRLQTVLDHENRSYGSQLDQTYAPILHSQITELTNDERKEIIRDFKMIVGSIVTLASPLSVTALSRLINIMPDVIDERLDALHSVLSVPFERTSPVRLLHLSFRDYLINPENRETVEFWVDEKLIHQNLARHCLRVMRGTLHKNMCDLSFPGTRRSTLDSSELEKYMPPQLQYACMYWDYHQLASDPKSTDENEVHDFLTTHLLHWMEVLSLMGRVKECLDSLRSLGIRLKNKEDSSLTMFVADAVRFLQANLSVIGEAPLQIYSCLVFAPSTSVVRMQFENAIPRWISGLPRVEESWNAFLLTLEGHNDITTSVVFSCDLKKLASASWDRSIRIWNAETGKCERELEGHSDNTRSVVFSQDSTKLASASDDKTIRIWSVETGECEKTLEGHDDKIRSAVYSHDSKKLLSASDDKTIRIWDAETGKCEQTLRCQGDAFRSVVFSHNSRQLASASSNKIRIWNTEEGNCERVLEGHGDTVTSVVFSHDSKRLASASWDKTIRIWNIEKGICEGVLKGHSDRVRSVTFSYDSKKLASTSDDKTIRTWNAEMAESNQSLEGHTGIITSVVFSYDLEKLASASYDKNIRIWNTKTGRSERVLEGHGDVVTSVVFSHDSKKLASASWDKTIRIWNGETGACEDTIPLDVYANVLSFTLDEIGVVTDNGVFAFTGRQTSYAEPRVSSHPSETSALVYKDSIWVKTRGKDLLWLPPECRNGEVATAGDTIAIGCRSGRVILLGISVADIQ